jgi:hypothetical protein
VLGNLGNNSFLAASRAAPVRLYIGDAADNHPIQQVLTVHVNGQDDPVEGRDELARVFPDLSRQFPTYASFAATSVTDIFSRDALRAASVLEATDFATSIAWNNGNGTFTLQPLPADAQSAPVRASLPADFDGDGRIDLLLAGNEYGVPPLLGRQDAGYGLVLRGSADRQWEPLGLLQTGVALDGQVRHLAMLRQASGQQLIVVARNDNTLQVLRLAHPPTASPGTRP